MLCCAALMAAVAPAGAAPVVKLAATAFHTLKMLSLAQRQTIWKAAMRGQLQIAEQTQDASLTRLLADEGRNRARAGEAASLSCATMKKIEAQDARQAPLQRALHRQITARYGISQATLEAILQEGERLQWPLPI